MTGTSNAAWLAAAAAMVLVFAGSSGARAETIVVDGQVTLVKSDIPRPSRGMTMKAVEAKFGAPRERHPTVGTPPITRWDYDHFAVFFEKDRVIHAVVTSGEAPSATPAEEPARAPAPTTKGAVPAPLA
ncbi:MAG TPA: hypothetical protein VHX52_07715 [Steroidobacteraceae bacterium]|nr:hypothetical protein [Steroidobacteraceae bacterium]